MRLQSTGYPARRMARDPGGGDGSPLIRGSVVNLIVIVVRVYCILYCNTIRRAAYRRYMDATTATTLYYR